MSILEKKVPDNLLFDIIQLLKFKNNPIELKGSLSYKYNVYSSDIDLFSQIKKKYDDNQIYEEFMSILEKSDINNLYFIEFKLQNKDGRKIKINDKDKITEDLFKSFNKNIEFVKIDYIIRYGAIFTELSIIYSFDKPTINFDKSILSEIKELINEKQYYKVLKRKFTLLKKEPEKNMKELLLLLRFFNSETGKEYGELNNLKAIKLLLENYDDPITKKLVENNLKILKLKPNLNIIDKNIKIKDKTINENGLEIYKKMF